MAKRKSSQWDEDERGGSYDERDPRGYGNGGRGDEDNYVTEMLLEAQALQHENRIDEAIELCEEIVATYGRADARYYLAWMYQEEHVWDGAIEHYTALLDDLDYALSCYYALGQCYRAKGDLTTAVHYFDEAVDRVNLDALTRDEADQLIQLCHEAAKTHQDLGDQEGTETVYSALLGFLRSRGWQDRVTQVEQLMAERRSGPAASRSSAKIPAVRPDSPAQSMPPAQSIPPAQGFKGADSAFLNEPSRPISPDQIPGAIAGMGMSPAASVPPMPAVAPMPPMPPAPLAGRAPIPGLNAGSPFGGFGRLSATPPPLPEPQRSQVINAMREVENYISHGLYTAAIEECLRVIEIAPQYLDVHQALAEIYVQQGKVDQAITKYAILIDTFLVNGRVDDAISAYRRILQLEPNNITYRVRLINLLAQHGRTDEMMGERISAAESYLKMGYPERAIEQFEQALVASPNNLGIRQSYALALVRAGRVNQGIAELQRILQIEPNNTLTLARWQIALCLGAGNLSSAGGLAQSNVRMMPGDGSTRVASLEILNRLIRTLRMEGMRKYEEIVHEYQSAIETSPTNGDLRYAMGVVFHAAGRHQEAISHYQAAMSAPGLDVLSHVGIGQALLGMNDAAAAASAVRELEAASAAARQAPLQPAVWAARPRLDGEDALAPDVEIAQILSRAYHRSNPNAAPAPYGMSPGVAANKVSNVPASRPTAFSEEITRTINEIAARHPNDTAGMLQELVQLVRHYRGQRQYEQAVLVLNEITRIAPEDASVRAELADIHITRGQLDEGIEELRRVAEIYMQHNQVNEAAATLQQIGEIQWQMGSQEPAMGTLKQVLNLTPDDMNARMLYVQYCLELGLRKEAAEQQTVLARYYYHSRQTREAVAMLQQLIALDKDNFEAYDLLGQTYFSVGEYDSAQRVYRHLTKSNPNSSLARERLAQIQEMRARR